jgi:hypothetical protein
MTAKTPFLTLRSRNCQFNCYLLVLIWEITSQICFSQSIHTSSCCKIQINPLAQCQNHLQLATDVEEGVQKFNRRNRHAIYRQKEIMEKLSSIWLVANCQQLLSLEVKPIPRARSL